jgi:hypothetical protein
LNKYNHVNIINKEYFKVKKLEGKTLSNFFAHIVGDQFNIAYLLIDTLVYPIHGLIGSEIIGIGETLEEISIINDKSKDIVEFPPFSTFYNKKICQIRMIGEAWNGHGFEFSFEDIYDKTMIIQSIYSGEKPEDYEDCLRLGIGCYYYKN